MRKGEKEEGDRERDRERQRKDGRELNEVMEGEKGGIFCAV